MPRQIRHDAHEHALELCDTGSTGFTCDGCGCPGKGFRYRCGNSNCDFDLHEFCATCPPAAPFFFHGQHPLTLESVPVQDDTRLCDLCDTRIKGMHYSCRPCGFEVHPICSQLPGAAVSPLHPQHLVMLTMSSPQRCTHCSEDCKDWRYWCAPCGVNLHPQVPAGDGPDPPLHSRRQLGCQLPAWLASSTCRIS